MGVLESRARMTGIMTVLQGWLADAEALAGRLPEAAHRIAAGSWPAILLAAALGLALLLAGSRLGRILSAAAAALVGFFVGGAVARAIGGPFGPSTWAWAVAAALAVATALAPAVYPAALGAVGGALLGAEFPIAGRAMLGGAVGALAGVVVALLLRRLVVAGTAAAAGATLLAAVLLALATRYPALAILRERPVLLAAAGALLFVSGTAFQLGAGVDSGGRAARARRAAGSRQPLEP
jgi:hypothetical protein